MFLIIRKALKTLLELLKDGFDGFGDPFGGGGVDPFGSPSAVSSDSKIVSPPIPPVIDDIQSFNEPVSTSHNTNIML